MFTFLKGNVILMDFIELRQKPTGKYREVLETCFLSSCFSTEKFKPSNYRTSPVEPTDWQATNRNKKLLAQNSEKDW